MTGQNHFELPPGLSLCMILSRHDSVCQARLLSAQWRKYGDVAQISNLRSGLWQKLWGLGSHFLRVLINFQFRI